MHFMVLVVGEKPKKQLAPFDKERHGGDLGGRFWRGFDWYQLGGRWTGSLPLRPGARGKLGKPGVFDRVPPPGHADQARKRDVDTASMPIPEAYLSAGVWRHKFDLQEAGDERLTWDKLDERVRERWRAEFIAMIDALPDDALLSLYDCHT